MVSGNPTSTSIPGVDGLSTDPPVLGRHMEVKTLEEPLYVSSPLETRVSVNLICRCCELEISGILLIVDLRVVDMSEFDVILRMDWLTVY